MSDTAEPTDGDGESPVVPAEADPTDADASETVPEVELGLYQVSVRVSGQAGDDLAEVEETATRLVDHLVERARTLEEEPDRRGLG